MLNLIPWIILAAPLVLLAAGLSSSASANARPHRMIARSLFAASIAFTVAIAAALGVAVMGPMVTTTIGIEGIGLGVYIDPLAAIMLALVSFVGLIVVRYSINYLDGDPKQGHFLKWLSITLAAVLTVMISGNLAQLIAAWVATSVSLNKLLLFYGERPAAQLAAKKKFIASRIGDLCLIAAACLLFSRFGTLEFAPLFARAERISQSGALTPAVMAAAVLIVSAALLKSAQLPVHGWLIEVMETPTPVSALLHAGIINAGGFLILRLSHIVSLSAPALEILTTVGGATALFGSAVMLTQTSIKVSLAYSTVAQMGFMMVECGLSAFSAASLHIVAHSLYKAHAFLSSGSVIDLARASWTPSPGGQPHPARLVLALLAVLGTTLGVAALFGVTFTAKPGAFVLGAIFLMGLVHLLAHAIDEKPSLYVLGNAAGRAATVAITFFALQTVFEHLLSSSLPAPLPLRGALDFTIVSLVILSFGAVTVFQSVMARHANTPFWRAVYVHLSHGLYLNTVTNQLVLRLWPRRRPAL